MLSNVVIFAFISAESVAIIICLPRKVLAWGMLVANSQTFCSEIIPVRL